MVHFSLTHKGNCTKEGLVKRSTTGLVGDEPVRVFGRGPGQGTEEGIPTSWVRKVHVMEKGRPIKTAAMAICLAGFMIRLDIYIANISLPAICRYFNVVYWTGLLRHVVLSPDGHQFYAAFLKTGGPFRDETYPAYGVWGVSLFETVFSRKIDQTNGPPSLGFDRAKVCFRPTLVDTEMHISSLRSSVSWPSCFSIPRSDPKRG